jgi:fibronectin type 3 domain-containing protein
MVSGNESVGGLLGYGGGTISSCYSTGSVSGTGDYVGGLCGHKYYGTLSSCYSAGSVSGNEYVGGLCGWNERGTLSSCYSTGAVSGKEYYVGGLCGSNESGSIVSCYSTGAVSGLRYVGGVCGYNSGTISSCFWDTETSGLSTSDGGIGKTTTQMQTESTFTDVSWDFVDVWKMGGFPVLQWQADYKHYALQVNNGIGSGVYSPGEEKTIEAIHLIFFDFIVWTVEPAEYSNNFADVLSTTTTFTMPDTNVVVTAVLDFYSGGTGTEEDPYLIGTKEDLFVLGNYTPHYDKHFKMTADIDLASTNFTSAVIAPDTDSAAQNFQGTEFTGVFDGNSNNVLNLSIDGGSTTDWVGLFGNIGEGGEVKNLGIVDCDISGNNKVGGLCGFNGGTLSSCYSTGVVRGAGSVGGLCGENAGSIMFCYSTVSASGRAMVGGICGYNTSGSISFCYSTGSASEAQQWAGGLCGYNNSGTISSCYATGAVSGDDEVGGLCGRNYNGTISSCFWDTETSGQSTSIGGVGKTTLQMQTESTFTAASWDFSNTWVMGTYPVLLVFGVPCDSPNSITASDGTRSDGVFTSWTTLDDATHYKIYRSTSETGTKVFSEWYEGTSYLDTNAVANVTYYYWLTASKSSQGALESGFSPYDTGYSFAGVPAPASISASDGTRTDGVALSWPTVDGATHYKIYRSTSETGTKVFSGWFAGTSLVDTTATLGVTYYYWVTAASSSTGDGESGFSPFDTGYSFAGLPAPASMNASDGTRADGVALSWPTVSGATHYKVYRSTSELGTKVFSGWFAGTSLVDTTATSGVTYYYWVTASKSSTGLDESGFSPYDTGYSLATLPAPASISASDGTRADGVALSWPSVSGATHYKVYRSTSELGTKVFSGWFSGMALIDTTATPGVTYYYWVTASKSSAGLNESDFSPFNTGYRSLDPYEPTDTTVQFDLTSYSGQWLSQVLGRPNISSFDDADYYKIYIPAGVYNLTVLCDFTNDFGNLDLYFYNADASIFASSLSDTDDEEITGQLTCVTSGYRYIGVKLFEAVPSYPVSYDLGYLLTPVATPRVQSYVSDSEYIQDYSYDFFELEYSDSEIMDN